MKANGRTMHKKFLFPLMAAFVWAAAPDTARAQGLGIEIGETESYAIPENSTSKQVAFSYYHLSKQAPDFDRWAQNIQFEKTKSGNLDPSTANEDTADGLRRSFDLLTLEDPIIVRMPVTLSAYHPDSQGYIVQDFQDDTFFSFHFVDRNYAVVPQDLMDKQFISVTPMEAAEIEKARQANPDGKVTLVFYLQPTFGDKSAPVSIDGMDFWLLSAKITSLALFEPVNGIRLWRTQAPVKKAPEEETDPELLKLYQ